MIQINLLPDVKAEYVKAQRNKRTIILITAIVSGFSLGFVVLMAGYVYIAQNIRLNVLENNIKSNSAKLKSIEGLDKILTIQNQLNKLTDLHNQKPVSERLFTYLSHITPNDVQISDFEIKYDDSTMRFSGTAGSIEAINKFVDTLKFTEYRLDQSRDQKRAFSEVVLSNFSVTKESSSGSGASYAIDMKFDPAIFSSDSKTVALLVPKITSTRSQTEQPNALFKARPTGEGGR